MKSLKFIETLTVSQFKNKTNVEAIDIKKNPRSGKLFMTYGASTGAVASKFSAETLNQLTRPMVSLVENSDGESFYILHQQGEGAPTLASF